MPAAEIRLSRFARHTPPVTELSEGDTHVSTVFIRASVDAVWRRITDPLEFPELYPAWTSEVEEVGEGTYLGTGPRGDEFVIRPELNREFGVVDFEVETGGAVERSRSRLFDVGETACQLVHLAVRWDGIDDGDWERHRRGTDDDLVRMKRLIEAEPAG